MIIAAACAVAALSGMQYKRALRGCAFLGAGTLPYAIFDVIVGGGREDKWIPVKITMIVQVG